MSFHNSIQNLIKKVRREAPHSELIQAAHLRKNKNCKQQMKDLLIML